MRRKPIPRQSDGEEALATRIRQLRLPEPVREYRFAPPRRFRFDFCWPDRGVAAEVDGGAYTQGRHTRGPGFERDCEKMNLATLRGWRVFRFTPGMVESGEALAVLEEVLT